MDNIFKNPTQYLEEIKQANLLIDQNRLNGKSTAAVFFTKVCKAGCPFCFFKSDFKTKVEFKEAQEMSPNGFDKFVDFINQSNNGYLMISGGGEPFEKYDYILKAIEQVKTDKMVIITSGYWANNLDKTIDMLENINIARSERGDDLDLILRVSVDEHHASRLGIDKTLNIVEAFEEKFLNENKFRLQFHTLKNDKAVGAIMDELNGQKLDYTNSTNEKNKNDNRYILQTPNGLNIQVEEAKLFLSNLKVNMNQDTTPSKEVFEEELAGSQKGNFSKVVNRDGQEGLDYLFSYNGNVTTWGNYQREDVPSLYVHSPEQIQDLLYNDIISYSFIDKDFDFRKNIVSEVNEKAAQRAVAINIRDFSGSYMLEENKTALYYAVRMTQEYAKDGNINQYALANLSPELQETIAKDPQEIKKEFTKANYTIFSQLAEKPFVKEEWDDTFELMRIGHYDINGQQAIRALDYYNKQTNNVVELIGQKEQFVSDEQQERLLEKVSPMNEQAANKFRELHKTQEQLKI